MNWDKATNIFWLVLGLFILEESYRLKIGSLRKPDSGLFPFVVGILFIGLSLILLNRASLKLNKFEREDTEGKISYRNIIWCVISLYAYALTFEWLGFIFSTFFFLIFLLKFIEHRGWITVITIALLTATGFYIFFEILLHAALPKGILGI